MNNLTNVLAPTGLEQLRAISSGGTGYEGKIKTLHPHPVSADDGLVVFEGSPTKAVYNPLGSVHGGYAATHLRVLAGAASKQSKKTNGLKSCPISRSWGVEAVQTTGVHVATSWLAALVQNLDGVARLPGGDGRCRLQPLVQLGVSRCFGL